LHEFLQSLDYLVSVLPHTDETDGLLDAGAFAVMPGHCCFINVGRGNLVDEEALVAALTDGELGGAVLDVFNQEPLPEDSPLWDTPGLSITAHVAAHSWPADIAAIFIDNYHRFVAGGNLQYLVDFERGY